MDLKGGAGMTRQTIIRSLGCYPALRTDPEFSRTGSDVVVSTDATGPMVQTTGGSYDRRSREESGLGRRQPRM
jgi:hypothetical protein